MSVNESERWRSAEVVLHRALELDEQEMPKFIRTACAGHDQLLKDVYSMLEAVEKPDSFLEDTALLTGLRVLDSQRAKLSSGMTLGRYQIIKPIGTGGMG